MQQSQEKQFDIAHWDLCWDDFTTSSQFQQLLKIDGNKVLVHYYFFTVPVHLEVNSAWLRFKNFSPYVKLAAKWVICNLTLTVGSCFYSWTPSGGKRDFSCLPRTAALNTGECYRATKEQNILLFQTPNPFFHSEKTGCWFCCHSMPTKTLTLLVVGLSHGFC